MGNFATSPIYIVIIVIAAIVSFLIFTVVNKIRKRSGKVPKNPVATTFDFEIDGQKGKVEIADNKTFSWAWNGFKEDVVKTVNAELATRIHTLITQKFAAYLGEQPKVQIEKITKEGVINARIYDVAHRTRSLRHVELLKDKDYGRQWLCGPNLVFALQKNIDGTLTVIRPPKSMEHPPSELYEALQTKDDVAEVLGNRSEEGDKIKLGLLVMAACVALFIMFMAIYKKGGG
jgi:hypothetical protein